MGLSVLAAGLAAALSTQATPAAQEQPPKQDHAELPPLIDSWYKILQGDSHAGYVHERLERLTGEEGRWAYSYQSQADLDADDPTEPGRKTVATLIYDLRARLDDTYAPLVMTVTSNVNGLELIARISVVEGLRRMELILPNGERRTSTIGAGGGFHYSDHLMFYSMRQNGQLAQPGPRQAKLFVFRAEGEPQSDVAFEVGAPLRRAYLGKESWVTRIAAPLPGPAKAGVQEFYVDRYGRVVEAVLAGGVRYVVAKSEEEATGKGKLLRPAGRRDPFRKDLCFRAPGGGERTSGGAKAGDAVVIKPDAIPQAIAEGQKMVDEIEGLHRGRRPDEAEKVYQKFLKYWLELRRAAAREPEVVLAQIDGLKKAVEKVHGGARRLLEQARQSYDGAVESLKRDDCADVEKRIAEMKKLADLPEFLYTQERVELAGLVDKLEPELERCRTRLELAKKKLEVSGTILSMEEMPQKVDASVRVLGHQVGAAHEVRFVKAQVLAVVNDKLYGVGDAVEGQGGVVVEKIWTHGVQFRLQKEVRDVPLRSK
jgi:hypothetical protein